MGPRHRRPVIPSSGRLAAALAAGPGWPHGAAHPGPLSGVRVLDLSRVLAGPYAAMVLSDLGADVIKVERPGAGDDTRGWGPPFHGTDATYFLSINRNRRALALDLTDPAGREVVACLARHADIVLENYLERNLTALGLAAVRDACQETTWVSVRGAGSDGPDAALPGYDVMAQARSGLMHVTGQPDGPATKVGVAITDVVAGLHAAVAALAGLSASARGAVVAPRIEVPLLETTLAALVNQAANHLIAGRDPARLGNDHPNLAPYGPLPCADRDLVLGAGNDRQFASLAAVLGLPDEPRFRTNASRVAHRSELHEALGAALRTRTAAAWSVELGAAGVPCTVVQSVSEAFADQQVAATDLVQTVEHPAGPVRLVGSPFRIDGARPRVRSAPPSLGRDTDEILTGLGVDQATVAALRTEGVVA